MPLSLTDAMTATARNPTAGERRQLAMLQTEVALDALRAGDLGAASLFLIDAIEHLKAARTPVADCPDPRVIDSLDSVTGEKIR